MSSFDHVARLGTLLLVGWLAGMFLSGCAGTLNRVCDQVAVIDEATAGGLAAADAAPSTPPEVRQSLERTADVVEEVWPMCFEEPAQVEGGEQ